MTSDTKLRVIYFLTFVGAGSNGLTAMFAPEVFKSLIFHGGQENPQTFAFLSSVLIGFGLVGLFGLFFPKNFVAVLVLQCLYKIVFLSSYTMRHLITGTMNMDELGMSVIFLVYVVLDILWIPWKEVFRNKPAKTHLL